MKAASKKNRSKEPRRPLLQSPLSAEDMAEICRAPSNDEWRSYFDELSTETSVDGTSALVRWHRIVHDGTHNAPDLSKLATKLIKLLIDFACTRGEIDAAKRRLDETGSADGFAELQEKARRLFTTSVTTGEPGELLLYFVAERLLRCPQILCKFPHKTNANVHAHGADGVHASVDAVTGHLRLHWGEAKFHQKPKNAIDECFESLAEMLHDLPQGKKSKQRDIELIRDYIELSDESLELAICQYLDPDNQLSNTLVCCGIAIIGFDLKSYDKLTSCFDEGSKAEIESLVEDCVGKAKGAIAAHNLQKIEMDVFCIPLKSVQQFRDVFLTKLGTANAN